MAVMTRIIQWKYFLPLQSYRSRILENIVSGARCSEGRTSNFRGITIVSRQKHYSLNKSTVVVGRPRNVTFLFLF